VSELFAGVCAITPTKRRRYLWCAWWSGAPVAKPFRKPDAWEGGARSEDEAQKAAEAAAGMPLRRIEGRWAQAWLRVRAGQKAFPERAAPEAARPAERRGPLPSWVVLGVARDASVLEIKRAFRRLALATHPDQGGSAEAFARVKRAYDSLLRRAERAPSARSRP
jgi:hypothetical protein